MTRAVSSARSPLAWLIAMGGFIAYLGLVFVLSPARLSPEVSLPWWVAQTAPPVLYALLVFAVARPRSGRYLVGGTLLLWAVHLLVGVATEVLAGAFQAPGGPGAVWAFPPPPMSGLLWVPLLLVPLRDALRGDSRARRPSAAARVQGRPPVLRPAPAASTSPATGRAPVDKSGVPRAARVASATPVMSMDVRYDSGRRPAPAAPATAAKPAEGAASSEASEGRVGRKETRAVPETSHTQRLLDDLLAKERSDEPVRISFERVGSQLPAEAFSVPIAEVAAALEEPERLLVPRRLALAQLPEGIVRVGWEVVAGQFPRPLLALSDEDIKGRLPNGQLVLPLDEVVRQFSPELFLPAGPGPDVRAIESFPAPFQPIVGLDHGRAAAVASPPEATAAPPPATEPLVAVRAAPPEPGEPQWAPVIELDDIDPEPLGSAHVPTGPVEQVPEAEAPSSLDRVPINVPLEAAPVVAPVAASPRVEEELSAWPAERVLAAAPAEPPEDSATWSLDDAVPAAPAPESPELSSMRGDLAAARALASLLGPSGPLEVDVRVVDGVELFTVTSTGLGEDLAPTAARLILPLLADGRAPWPIDQVTLRGPRAALVLTLLGPLAAGGPVLAATVHGGRSLALLEIRCRAAAAGYAARMHVVPADAAASTDERDEPDLLDVEPSTRLREVASSLGALGPVTASALRDAEADRAIYLFLPPGSDVRMVGALANDLSRAMREAAATGMVWSVAILRSGSRRMVVRLPGAASACSDTIVAAGETTRPGLAYRQVEHAAAALGAL